MTFEDGTVIFEVGVIGLLKKSNTLKICTYGLFFHLQSDIKHDVRYALQSGIIHDVRYALQSDIKHDVRYALQPDIEHDAR